jgi:putative endonuclease
MFRNKSSQVGQRGEFEAKKYLQDLGYEILSVNFCNYSGRRIGEIDIVAKDKQEIVFIEVKSRTLKSAQQPLAEASITRSKLNKLNKIASFYISKNNLWNNSYRFDAISVYFSTDGQYVSMNHLQSIFL